MDDDLTDDLLTFSAAEFDAAAEQIRAAAYRKGQAAGEAMLRRAVAFGSAVGADGNAVLKALPILLKGGFDESKHPRDGGKFAEKEGAGAGDKAEPEPEGDPVDHDEYEGSGTVSEDVHPDHVEQAVREAQSVHGLADDTARTLAKHLEDKDHYAATVAEYIDDSDDRKAFKQAYAKERAGVELAGSRHTQALMEAASVQLALDEVSDDLTNEKSASPEQIADEYPELFPEQPKKPKDPAKAAEVVDAYKAARKEAFGKAKAKYHADKIAPLVERRKEYRGLLAGKVAAAEKAAGAYAQAADGLAEFIRARGKVVAKALRGDGNAALKARPILLGDGAGGSVGLSDDITGGNDGRGAAGADALQGPSERSRGNGSLGAGGVRVGEARGDGGGGGGAVRRGVGRAEPADDGPPAAVRPAVPLTKSFDESKHPRDHGKFAEKPGAKGGGKKTAKQPAGDKKRAGRHGEAGEGHPLAGMSYNEKFHALAAAVGAEDGMGGGYPPGGKRGDPLGYRAQGAPGHVDMDALKADIHAAIRDTPARGMLFDDLYAELGERHDMSKSDFARAMTALGDEGATDTGLKFLSMAIDKLDTHKRDFDLVTMDHRGEVIYQVRSTDSSAPAARIAERAEPAKPAPEPKPAAPAFKHTSPEQRARYAQMVAAGVDNMADAFVRQVSRKTGQSEDVIRAELDASVKKALPPDDDDDTDPDDTDTYTPTGDDDDAEPDAHALLAVALAHAERCHADGRDPQPLLDALHELGDDKELLAGVLSGEERYAKALEPYTPEEYLAAAIDATELARRTGHDPQDFLDALHDRASGGTLKKAPARHWDESKHNRDHGKFSHTAGAKGKSGKPVKPPTAKQQAKEAKRQEAAKVKQTKESARAEAQKLTAELVGYQNQGKKLPPEKMRALIPHLTHLADKDLGALRKALAASGANFGGGKIKADRVAALVGWAKGEVFKKRRGKADSVLQAIVDHGGIDPNSHAFKTHYSSIAHAREDGIPLAAFKRGGGGLDALAQELHNSGLLTVPEGADQGEYVLNLLKRGGKTNAASLEKDFDAAYEEYARGLEEGGEGEGKFDPNAVLSWDDEPEGAFWKALKWSEHLHPRGRNGRFISRDRIEAAKSDPKLRKELRKEVKPEDKKKLEDALAGKSDIGKTAKTAAKHATEAKRAKVTADRDAMKALRSKLSDQAIRGKLEADDLHAMIPHLSMMSGKELSNFRELLQNQGVSFGGEKKVEARRERVLAWAKAKALDARMDEHGFSEDEKAGALAAIGPKDAGDGAPLVSDPQPEVEADDAPLDLGDVNESPMMTGRPVVDAAPLDLPPAAPPAPKPKAHPLAPKLRAAIMDIAGGKEAVRVRLSDLRARFPDVLADELTAAVKNLSKRDELTLYPLDDPRQIKDADRAAAIESGSGVPQHILYYGGISSRAAAPEDADPLDGAPLDRGEPTYPPLTRRADGKAMAPSPNSAAVAAVPDADKAALVRAVIDSPYSPNADLAHFHAVRAKLGWDESRFAHALQAARLAGLVTAHSHEGNPPRGDGRPGRTAAEMDQELMEIDRPGDREHVATARPTAAGRALLAASAAPDPASNPEPAPDREPSLDELEGGPKPAGQERSRKKRDQFSPAEGERFAGEKPKVEYVRAAAGGQTSDVDGKFYSGGQLMPVHGKYSGMEKPPKGNGVGTGDGPGKANPDAEGGGGRGSKPLTAEQAAERRAELEAKDRAVTLQSGPLGKLTAINSRTGLPVQGTRGGVPFKPWKEFAESVGEEKLKHIVDSLPPPTDPAEREEYDYQLNHPQDFKGAQTKKHAKDFPSSADARHAIKTALENAKTPEAVQRLHDLLTAPAPVGGVAPPTKPPTTPRRGGREANPTGQERSRKKRDQFSPAEGERFAGVPVTDKGPKEEAAKQPHEMTQAELKKQKPDVWAKIKQRFPGPDAKAYKEYLSAAHSRGLDVPLALRAAHLPGTLTSDDRAELNKDRPTTAAVSPAATSLADYMTHLPSDDYKPHAHHWDRIVGDKAAMSLARDIAQRGKMLGTDDDAAVKLGLPPEAVPMLFAAGIQEQKHRAAVNAEINRGNYASDAALSSHPDLKAKQDWYDENAGTYWDGKSRRTAVESAVKGGKPVPPEVLADYPDLAPKPPTKPRRGGREANPTDAEFAAASTTGTASPAAALDLNDSKALAAAVHDAARSVPAFNGGTYAPGAKHDRHKVLIGTLYDHMSETGKLPAGTTLDAFKAALSAAHRAGPLTLSRNDLPQFTPPDQRHQQARSATPHPVGRGEWHAVDVPTDAPAPTPAASPPPAKAPTVPKDPKKDAVHLNVLAKQAPTKAIKDALETAAWNVPSGNSDLKPDARRAKTLERLASVWRQHHDGDVHAGINTPDLATAAHLAGVIKDFGGELRHAVGDTVPFDGRYHESDTPAFTGDTVRVVRPAVVAAGDAGDRRAVWPARVARA